MPSQLLKVRATVQNTYPANVREMKARIPVMYAGSQKFLSLRPESFRKDIKILRKEKKS